MEIGKKIKELRVEKGFSQEQLANLSYISFVTLNRIENGHHDPSKKLKKLIADALGVSVEDLG